jgi:hypothetical protein
MADGNSEWSQGEHLHQEWSDIFADALTVPQDPPAHRSRPASARTRMKRRLPYSNRVSALPLFSGLPFGNLGCSAATYPGVTRHL